jgi:hypothetical protein
MELNELFAYVSYYYENRFGYFPDKKYWETTYLTLWYLNVNNLNDSEILSELNRHDTIQISVSDLSEELWKNSLTQKGKFYFHHELQIISPAPVFSLKAGASCEEDWCVPKIRFTYQDLVNYFWYNISQTEREIWILGHNTDKEINYLLLRFRNSFQDIDPLDYLMFLLDEMIRDENKQHIKGLISVTDYIGNTLETYRNMILEAKAKGFDKPRWPSCF